MLNASDLFFIDRVLYGDVSKLCVLLDSRYSFPLGDIIHFKISAQTSNASFPL